MPTGYETNGRGAPVIRRRLFYYTPFQNNQMVGMTCEAG